VPQYKNDNTLREYQLEGLNWLTFCYYNKLDVIPGHEYFLLCYLDQYSARIIFYFDQNIVYFDQYSARSIFKGEILLLISKLGVVKLESCQILGYSKNIFEG